MLLHRNTAALLDELSRWGDTRTIFDASSFKIDYETDASLDAEADDDSTVGVLGIGNPLESSDSMAMYYRSRSFTPRLTWTKCLRPAGVAVAPWAPNCIYVAGKLLIINYLYVAKVVQVSQGLKHYVTPFFNNNNF